MTVAAQVQTYEVVYFDSYGGFLSVDRELIHKIKSHKNLKGLIGEENYTFLLQVPRHNKTLVKIVREYNSKQMQKTNRTWPNSGLDIQVITSPKYTILEAEGKERVISESALHLDASK